MSTAISYGTKYEATKSLSRVQIAKLVRADIKAAVASGARGVVSVAAGATVRILTTGMRGVVGDVSTRGQCRVDLADGRWGWHYPGELEAVAFDIAAARARIAAGINADKRAAWSESLRHGIESRPCPTEVLAES